MIHNSLLKKKDSKPSNFPHDCSFNAPNQTTLRRPKKGLKHKASSPKNLAPFSLSLGERTKAIHIEIDFYIGRCCFLTK
jgi:hypothetical protein